MYLNMMQNVEDNLANPSELTIFSIFHYNVLPFYGAKHPENGGVAWQ